MQRTARNDPFDTRLLHDLLRRRSRWFSKDSGPLARPGGGGNVRAFLARTSRNARGQLRCAPLSASASLPAQSNVALRCKATLSHRPFAKHPRPP